MNIYCADCRVVTVAVNMLCLHFGQRNGSYGFLGMGYNSFAHIYLFTVRLTRQHFSL